jgi:hypothetical protein
VFTHGNKEIEMNHKDLQTVLDGFKAEPHTADWDNAISILKAEIDKPEDEALAEEVGNLRESYQQACQLVAQMHEAAMGVACGPIDGVVDDVIALRKKAEKLAMENAALRAGLAYYKQRVENLTLVQNMMDEYGLQVFDLVEAFKKDKQPTFQDAPPAPVKPVEVYPFSNAGLA